MFDCSSTGSPTYPCPDYKLLCHFRKCLLSKHISSLDRSMGETDQMVGSDETCANWCEKLAPGSIGCSG